MPQFDDLKPWPSDEIEAAGLIHHNQPPLEDQVLIDFDTALRLNGLDKRLIEITEAATDRPEIDTHDKAGAAGDLIAMARAASEKVNAEREALNRPLLTAQRSLKAKADALLAPMGAALATVQASLDAYMAQHPEPVRGDYGARVGTKTSWHFEIESFAKLPKSIRQHDDVIAAIEKVIRARIRGGEHEIAGVRIWSDQTAVVR